jgi:hypothetical protein
LRDARGRHGLLAERCSAQSRISCEHRSVGARAVSEIGPYGWSVSKNQSVGISRPTPAAFARW